MEASLLSGFEPVSYDQWKAAVEAELKGVPFDKKLLTPTPEGITLKPVYTPDDTADLSGPRSFPGFPPYLRGSTAAGPVARGWEVSQEIDFANPAEFNEAARHSVERGLTALNIVLDRATRKGHDPDWAAAGDVGVGGLSIATLQDLDRALAGIDLEKISLFIRSGSSAMPVAALLVALARARGQNEAKIRGCIEMDPLGVLSHEGSLPHSLEGAYQEMAQLTRWADRAVPALQTVCVHTRVWHEGGGHAVQELAFGLATGVEYLRAMHRHQLGVNSVAPRIRFAMTVGTSFFMEIAKLRAARVLWNRVVEAAGGSWSSRRLHLHARTSLRNKSSLDPQVNILRATVEAFAAVLGGVDSLQVGAFDEVAGTPDEFSRRLARNTQLVLLKECDLTRFADAPGGSWYVERLTAQLAEKAWALFQEVERLGGMAAAMAKGFPQKEIAGTRAARARSLAERRSTLIGVNKYANPLEPRYPNRTTDVAAFQRKRRQQVIAYRTQSDDDHNAAVLRRLADIVEKAGSDLFSACIDAAQSGASLGEITRAIRISDAPARPIQAVPLERLAGPFERLRRAAAEQARAPVFLAAIGPGAQHRARAEFSRAFFEVAGLRVIYPSGFAGPEEAVEAAAKEGARWVVLCSTDDTYPALVPAFMDAMKKRLPQAVAVLAGYPQEQVETFRSAGLENFIHLRSNILDTLFDLTQKGGISLV